MKRNYYKYKVVYTTKTGAQYTLWARTKVEANEMVAREKKNGAAAAYIAFA